MEAMDERRDTGGAAHLHPHYPTCGRLFLDSRFDPLESTPSTLGCDLRQRGDRVFDAISIAERDRHRHVRRIDGGVEAKLGRGKASGCGFRFSDLNRYEISSSYTGQRSDINFRNLTPSRKTLL